MQDHPAVRHECHEETQRGAHEDWRKLPVFDVHSDEHEALDREDGGGHRRELRSPVKSTGNDQPDRAEELEVSEHRPDCCGSAPKDGSCSRILSNMKTFMTADAAY